MGRLAELSERERRILFFVVDDYIRRGEPVASAAVAKSGIVDVSSATIRNVMSALEDSEFLAQPHTSAGRIPTTTGIRTYVDFLTNRYQLLQDDADPGQLRQAFENLPDEDVASIARHAGLILSQFSSMAGLVLGPDLNRVRLKDFRLVQLSPRRVLAVLVTQRGGAMERVVRLEEETDPASVTRMQNYLSELVVGKTLRETRAEVRGELSEAQTQYRNFIRNALAIGVQVLGEDESERLHVEGVMNFLDFNELAEDTTRLRELVHALDEKEQVISILDCIAEARDPLTFVGPELGWELGDDFSLVVRGYYRDSEQVGLVGVLGPIRMDYRRMIPLVDRAARVLSRELDEGA